jgi:hypothetical protein
MPLFVCLRCGLGGQFHGRDAPLCVALACPTLKSLIYLEMADLEGASSNAFFEVLEEWNAVLEAERHLLEQALQADETSGVETDSTANSQRDAEDVDPDRPTLKSPAARKPVLKLRMQKGDCV